MGRASVQLFNSTILEVDSSIELEDGLGKMIVSSWGDNQMARYGLHAHHSLVPMEFSGNGETLVDILREIKLPLLISPCYLTL